MLEELPTWALVAGGLVAIGAIVGAGVPLSRHADHIADRLGIAKTVLGAMVLGATTSLPGIIASVLAALEGLPRLAAANAVGGIAAQTAFLAVADIFYRRANLEHDAASIGNIVQAGLLLFVLTIPLIASATDLISDWPIHPASFLLVIVYVVGLRAVHKAGDLPMWIPQGGHVEGVDEEAEGREGDFSTHRLLGRTALLALLVAASGFLVTKLSIEAIDRFELGEAAVGAIFTAIVTSLPELVTTVAAVRYGALSLAVGGILGGNAFDVLFLAAADCAWLEGSIYHQAGDGAIFQLAVSCSMVSILVLGLAIRQQRGPGNIGFESLLVLLLYALSLVVVVIG